MSEPTLIIIAGLRESGKTTLRKKMQDVDDYVFAPDEKYNQLAQEKDLKKDDIVRKIMPNFYQDEKLKMVEVAKNNQNVIIEVIGLSTKGRSIYKDKECFRHYRKEVWFILPPQNEEEMKELKERISKRKNKSPHTEAGLKEHLNIIAIPNLDEGFDVVKYFNIYGELTDYNSNVYQINDFEN